MKSKFKIVLFVIIILLTAWQALEFARFAADEIPTVWRWIGKPAQWRSAAHTTSETFADYISFANQLIPTDAVVAIPSSDLASWQFSFVSFQEYLLFPRLVTACSTSACLQQTAAQGGYALIEDTGAFLTATTADLKEQIIPFNNRWSILAPDANPTPSGASLQGFNSITRIAFAMVLPLLWLAIVGIPGLALVSFVLPDWRWLARFFLGLTLGMGILSFLLYLMLLATGTIRTGLILLATVLWIGVSSLVLLLLNKSGYDLHLSTLRPILKLNLPEVVILICAAVVGLISIGKSYWGTDGIILWSLKGYAISAFGLAEGVSNWGSLSARYPLQVPILISAFKTMFGDLVPQSKVLPVVFYLSFPLVAVEYFRTRFQRQQYIWFILLWLFSPQIVWHGTIGYANLPLTFYLTAAVVIALIAFDQSSKTGLLTLSGVLFTLAAWNRPEGVVLAAVALLLIFIWQRKPGTTWMLYLPLIIFTVIWSLTKDLVYLQAPFTDGYLSDGLLNVFKGNIIWGDIGYLITAFFKATLNPAEWGLIGWLILLGLITFILFRRTTPEINVLLISGILLTLATATVVYLRAYNPNGCDVSCMVATALERLVLPGIALLWLGNSQFLLSIIKSSKETGA